jgi:hypothetical protein
MAAAPTFLKYLISGDDTETFLPFNEQVVHFGNPCPEIV